MHNTAPILAEPMQSYWQQLQQNQQALEFIEQHQLTDRVQRTLSLSDFVARNLIKYSAQLLPCIQHLSQDNLSLLHMQKRLSEQLLLCQQESQLYQALRQFRQIELTKLALAEIVHQQPIEQQIKQLSWLAEALIIEARDWLAQFYQSQWGQAFNAQGQIMPLMVYGMGKLGGRELNFSSDIDLIFSYAKDGDTQGGRRSLSHQQYFTRLAQKLIQALTQVTQDGFVYRVDMRLRPFGDSGPLVLSFAAMEDYYQDQGRDWERYAMVKARLLGQSEYHHELTQLLRPFVYRRYIDFSVIDSLRRMKLLLTKQALRFEHEINIKLGNGGIRELEFIVQAWQLIRGGREPELQTTSWHQSLKQLVALNILDKNNADALAKAYAFLRRMENILQAIDDQQTQLLPHDELNQQRLYHSMGFASWTALLTELAQQQQVVATEFKLLISEQEHSEAPQLDDWQAIWSTQDIAQRGALLTSLLRCDEQQVSQYNQQIHNFKQQLRKRSIGQRGRQTLDKLMPQVLLQLNQQPQFSDNQGLFTLFDKIASRTAYLELLYENQGALTQLLKLCNQSAWLAEQLAQYPILLDELLDPLLFSKPPKLEQYHIELNEQVVKLPQDDIEAQMDLLRHFKQAQQLRIAIADLVGVLPVTQVSDHLTALAQAIIGQVVELAWQQLVHKHGLPSATQRDACAKGLAIIGYGKLGGNELAYSSDLDLVFLHNSAADAMTNGDKPISDAQFYAKLVQKMLHIFNTRMLSGILYELDMRLRPSGNAGVLVTSMATFEQYQQQEAWTWEHQALVRARCIYGEADLMAQFQRIRHGILTQPLDNNKLQQEVVAMREKMRAHLDQSTEQVFDIKQGQGGLVDIEFLVQFWLLNYGFKHPELTDYSDNQGILKALLKAGKISQQDHDLLNESYCYLRDLGHSLTLAKQDSQLISYQQLQHAEQIAKVRALWQQVFEQPKQCD